jgi:hypothetical protein
VPRLRGLDAMPTLAWACSPLRMPTAPPIKAALAIAALQPVAGLPREGVEAGEVGGDDLVRANHSNLAASPLFSFRRKAPAAGA